MICFQVFSHSPPLSSQFLSLPFSTMRNEHVAVYIELLKCAIQLYTAIQTSTSAVSRMWQKTCVAAKGKYFEQHHTWLHFNILPVCRVIFACDVCVCVCVSVCVCVAWSSGYDRSGKEKRLLSNNTHLLHTSDAALYVHQKGPLQTILRSLSVLR